MLTNSTTSNLNSLWDSYINNIFFLSGIKHVHQIVYCSRVVEYAHLTISHDARTHVVHTDNRWKVAYDSIYILYIYHQDALMVACVALFWSYVVWCVYLAKLHWTTLYLRHNYGRSYVHTSGCGHSQAKKVIRTKFSSYSHPRVINPCAHTASTPL